MKYKKRGRRKKKTSIWKRISTGIRRGRKRFGKWFKKLSRPKKVAFVTIVTMLILLLAAGCFVYGYIKNKLDKVNTEEIKPEDIFINEELDEVVGTGYTNFVLFGSDSRDDSVDKNLNTDTIIIASLNNATKEVKLISVYRDTLLDIKGGNIQKCNSAYARGGAAQAINMLNKNLDLNIQKYVTVSFGVVVDIVDMVGGIEVDVTDAEARAVNEYVEETGYVAGKQANRLKGGGRQVLDGVQATTYARIRKGVGDDYARTARQRLVIEKIFEKMLQSDIGTINKIIDAILPQVSTNLTSSEIMSYAAGVFGYSITESAGFPFESNTGMIGKRGSCLYATTLASNVSQLHEVLFGTVDYQPSSTVKSISNEVAYLVSSSKSSGSSSSSSESDDVITTPSTNTDTENKTETTTPNTGNSGTTTPSTGNSGTTTPSTGNGGTTTPPSTGEDTGTTTPPSTEGDTGTTTPPSTGGDTGTTTPPSTGGDSGTTTPPASGDGGGTTPPPSTGGTESSGGGDAGSADSGAGASTEGE